jgi:hypothetical protein
LQPLCFGHKPKVKVVTKTLKKDLKINFEHPLTSKAPLHGKHFHLMHPIRGKKKKSKPK